MPATAARERAAEMLRHVGLYDERYRPIGGYSTGMKQRVKLAQALTIPVIASGGLSNLDDVKRLQAVEDEGIMGVIAGRSIYEGTLDFKQALELTAGQ